MALFRPVLLYSRYAPAISMGHSAVYLLLFTGEFLL